MDGRKLDKIRVRYFPPALILEFIDKDKSKDTELIDLLIYYFKIINGYNIN